MRRIEPPVPRLETVVVLSLAASRLARAVSVDEVTAPLRERLSAHAATRGTVAWRRIDELVHCPLCTGWWVSLAVSIVSPGRQRLLRGVSVAGMQVVLSLAERWISEEGRAAIVHTDLVQSTVDDGEPAGLLAAVGAGRP